MLTVSEARVLQIYFERQHVGHLLEEQDIWTLKYDASWSRSAQAFDLSPALPRHQLEHRDGSTVRTVQWFFDNLLPEEHLREAVCREANVRDAFDVLRYLGRESAGALTLLPPGEALPTDSAIVPLPDDALARRIRNLPQQTLIHDAPKKMSAAGAQHKLLLVVKEGELFEPAGATPSTHILKPDHPDVEHYPASAYNEFLTMRLARAAGLLVPDVILRRLPDDQAAVPVYIIERFDRLGSFPDTQRKHIIDACQLLNISRTLKYSRASLETLYEISTLSANPAATRFRLFRWLVFNVFLANDDSHLKNLSFVMTALGPELAPHYDLLSTSAYHTRALGTQAGPWPAVRMAIELPGAARFNEVKLDSLIEAGKALRLPAEAAARIVNDVAKGIRKALASPELAPATPIEQRVFKVVDHMIVGEMAGRIVGMG